MWAEVMRWQHLVPVSRSLFDDGLHVCDVSQEQSHVQHALRRCLLCGVQVHVQIWGRAPLKIKQNIFKHFNITLL